MINAFLIALATVALHAHHISVCEITYNKSEKSLQVVQTVFADDLENHLKQHLRRSYFDVRKNDTETTAEMLAFTREHFKLFVDSSAVDFVWIGSKIEGNEAKFFFEYPAFEATQFHIESSLFHGFLPGQENVIHLLEGPSRKTRICTETQPRATFQLE